MQNYTSPSNEESASQLESNQNIQTGLLPDRFRSLPIPLRPRVEKRVTYSEPKEESSLDSLYKNDDDFRSNGIFLVLKNFVPTEEDEISLVVGDIVKSNFLYDDGWSLGVNITQKSQEGIFPLLHYCQPLLDTLIPSLNLDTLIEDTKILPRRQSSSAGISSELKYSKKHTTILKAFKSYTPQIADELEIKPGECLEALKTFDDGWAFGRSFHSDEVGFFPLQFCIAVSNSNSDGGFSDSSSLKNATPSLQGIAWLIKVPTPSEPLQMFEELKHSPTSESIISKIGSLDQTYSKGSALDSANEYSSLGDSSLDVLHSKSSTIGINSRTSSIYSASLPSVLFDHLRDSLSSKRSLRKNKSVRWSMVETGSTKSVPMKRTTSVRSPERKVFSSKKSSRSRNSLPSYISPHTEIIATKRHLKFRPDELNVIPGQRILVLEIFDDGWAFGISFENKVMGKFPLSIV
ncbi:Sorbin and SH3 domain-containing protein 1 [Nowakowskiella sp. JEL0078]|nr:Sorbin and SH3 domain-containing protein 1 [Nowakowskiella sp. JEL0078]